MTYTSSYHGSDGRAGTYHPRMPVLRSRLDPGAAETRANHDAMAALVDDLRAGRLTDEVPPHGTLARVRQKVPADRWTGRGAQEQAKVDAR